MKVALPDWLAEQIPGLFGERGRAWVDALPGVVGELVRRWDLTVVGPALAGGTHSYVVPVRRAGYPDDLVLKVPVLDNENYAESAALRCYGGDGAVLLHGLDLASGALLLEAADPDRSLLATYERGELPMSAVVDVATGVLRRLRRAPAGDLRSPAPAAPAPEAGTSAPPGGPDQPFPLVRDLAERWSHELVAEHDQFGRPYDQRLFLAAAEWCTEFAACDTGGVIVNRDGHLGNILASRRPARDTQPWLLIDPKPMLGEPAFDAGHLMWDLLRWRPTVAQARYLTERVADGLEVPRERVRAWALVRAVDNITWAYPEGEAQPYADAASALYSV